MALHIGIVGLPNVGKSTLFNALTRTQGAEAANYPFCTIDPNIGVVEVPDERLKKLSEMVQPEKTIPAAIEFKDIAGLVKGASKGEGLGNQFLHAIRESDALCHVVRLFDGDTIHVEGSVDPQRDRETIETEIILADLETLDNRLDKARGAARSGDKEKIKEVALCEKIHEVLNNGKMASTIEMTDEEQLITKSLHLLTTKPLIYACNVSENQLGTLSLDEAKRQLGLEGNADIILVSAKIEEDLLALSPEEAKEFLSELGVHSSGLDNLIQAAYSALGYISFFTAGPKEVRAWNVRKGSSAPQAAGVIHTDFEKGFIRAETIAYSDFVDNGGESGAKEAGKLRLEGKEYVVNDGDIFHFRFNT